MDSETHGAPAAIRRGAFAVTAGLHRGATFAATDDLLLLGADTSCDICLSDAGLAARHAAIVAQGARTAIRRLDGAVSVNGQPLPQQGAIALASGAEIALGESGVRVRFLGAEELAADGSALSAEERADGKARTPSHAARGARAQARPMPRFTLTAVLAGLAVLAIAFGARQLQASRPAGTTADVAASSAKAAPVNESDLVAQVQDVFRTSGYDAQVSYLGRGEILVENLDRNHERVRRAAERVKADVPQLASLSFAPDDASKPAEHAPPFASAGVDRMTVSFNGDTGYLAADDGARYFVGSVLPGGLTVRRITNDAVQVDREGQISWYRL